VECAVNGKDERKPSLPHYKYNLQSQSHTRTLVVLKCSD